MNLLRSGRWWLAAALAASLPDAARADVFAYVDKDGVLHLTNVPDDPRYRPYLVDGKQNTYRLQDEIGNLQHVYRVDVGEYDDLIREASAYYSLPAALIKAVIAVESNFEPAAVSPAGAQGLMQLMPFTAREMQVGDSFDPRDNIFGGVRYLRLLANQFNGDVRLTVAAYNAGPKAVVRAADVPPIPETQRYVRRVLALYRHYLTAWPGGVR